MFLRLGRRLHSMAPRVAATSLLSKPGAVFSSAASGNSSHSGSAHSTTHFGFREVGRDDKAHMVGEVFARVAKRYDIMNDLMSAGVHR
jgi:hypothetical protein